MGYTIPLLNEIAQYSLMLCTSLFFFLVFYSQRSTLTFSAMSFLLIYSYTPCIKFRDRLLNMLPCCLSWSILFTWPIMLEVLLRFMRDGVRMGERQHCCAHFSSHLMRQGFIIMWSMSSPNAWRSLRDGKGRWWQPLVLLVRMGLKKS